MQDLRHTPGEQPPQSGNDLGKKAVAGLVSQRLGYLRAERSRAAPGCDVIGSLLNHPERGGRAGARIVSPREEAMSPQDDALERGIGAGQLSNFQTEIEPGALPADPTHSPARFRA